MRKIADSHAPGMPGTFLPTRELLFSYPGLYHGTYIMPLPSSRKMITIAIQVTVGPSALCRLLFPNKLSWVTELYCFVGSCCSLAPVRQQTITRTIAEYMILCYPVCWCIYVTSSSMSSWWRHQMETFSALLVVCHRLIPHTKASDAELWCFIWSAPE